MSNLYLTESGCKLARQGSRLLVKKDDQIVLDSPIHRLEGVYIFGRSGLTADCLALLLARNVRVALFSSRGQYRGNLAGPFDKALEIRHAQHICVEKPDKCLYFAKNIVKAKIFSSCAVLRRYGANHPECDIKTAAAELKELALTTDAVTSTTSLLGHEGNAARIYFAALGTIFSTGQLQFDGRNRRPPTDPINALLSYGYVILSGLLTGLLQAAGLEPYLGFYHTGANRNQPALALDLIEEFRHPIVDRFVMYLIHKNCLQLSHFDKKLTSFMLNATGRKIFFTQWDKWLHTEQSLERNSRIKPLELFGRQIERLSAWLKQKDQHYKPFILEA